MLPPCFKEKRRLLFSRSNLIQCMSSEGLKAHEMTKLLLDPHLTPCRSCSFRTNSWILEHLPVLKYHIFTATHLLPCKHKCSSHCKPWTVSIVQASNCIRLKGKQQNSGTAFLVRCCCFKTVTKATQMITVAHFKTEHQVCQMGKTPNPSVPQVLKYIEQIYSQQN